MRSVICGLILAAGPAAAMAGETARPTLEGELGIVSDYRYRGLSLSEGGAAIQGGVTGSLPNGLYASAWASTIAEYGAGPDGDGAKVEIDYALGWAFEASGVSVDVAVNRYTYPGGRNVDYFEFPVSVGRAWSDWSATVGAAYAPAQSALGDEDNAYAFAKLAWARPSVPFAVAVQAGRETGAFAPGGKWDWSAGVTRQVGALALGLTLVDSDVDAPALVAGVTAAF